MLNTKNMKSGGGKVGPVISLGNQVFRINDLTFDVTPYDSNAYDIKLHVETEPIGGDFKGFLVDPSKQNGPRHKGQVGRIRFSPYAYRDTTLPSGIEINRDQEVLKAMIFLAETLEVRDQLDMIEAVDIFEFMKACRKIFSNSNTYLNACVGGSEWKRAGEDYVNYNLFLPKLSKDGVPLERLDVENSRLLKYNPDKHIIKKKEKPSTVVKETSLTDDFDLF
jgi:hypothetical protein